MRDSSLAPQITPLADGGVQSEWHRRHRDLEIIVYADGAPTYYFFDDVTKEQEDAAFAQHEVRIRDLIDGSANPSSSRLRLRMT
jgi:hypothetical protein